MSSERLSPVNTRTLSTTGSGHYSRSRRRQDLHATGFRDGRERRDDRTAQALNRARPLCRRAATIARPARVRIRSRKPWVRARRRLLGWNVRLLTSTPTTVCQRRFRLLYGKRPAGRRSNPTSQPEDRLRRGATDIPFTGHLRQPPPRLTATHTLGCDNHPHPRRRSSPRLRSRRSDGGVDTVGTGTGLAGPCRVGERHRVTKDAESGSDVGRHRRDIHSLWKGLWNI